MERKHVYYSGKVQGIGFRATAQHLASGFGLAGFVHNMPDGRVEMIVEGAAEKIGPFLEAILREMGHKIRDIDIVAEPPGEPHFDGFEIH